MSNYWKHKSLIVTACSFASKELEECRNLLLYELNNHNFRNDDGEKFDLQTIITPISVSPYNSYYSFVMLPTGSYENWPVSNFVDDVIIKLVRKIDQVQIDTDQGIIRNSINYHYFEFAAHK